jgi:ABC-type nickel/cobalt efflux system permease component RcnA
MQQMVDNQSTIDVKISDLTKEIAEMKQKYNDEQQKIEQRFQEQLSTLTIQQHKAAITIMNSLFSSNNV